MTTHKPTPITKEMVDEVIKYFGEGRIDSVLGKTPRWFDTLLDVELPKLCRLWLLCGNDKTHYPSLQQIADEARWETVEDKMNEHSFDEPFNSSKVLKSPAAGLFEFLFKLMLKK